MHYLTRPNELDELSEARRKYDGTTPIDQVWEQFGEKGEEEKSSKQKVREQLEAAQYGLCAYCENGLENNGHIDHFKPKSSDWRLTFDWNNLIASCTHNDSCGGKKGNQFKNYWINPYITDPNGMFSFYANGEIIGNSEEAKKIIKDFGLDCPRLEQKRQGVLSTLEKNILAIIDIPEALEYFVNDNSTIFPTAHSQIIKKIIGA